VYPALTVLQALQAASQAPEVEKALPGHAPRSMGDLSVLWVGSVGGMEEELVTRAGVPYEAVEAGQMHGVDLRAMPGNLLQVWRGYRQARRVLAQFRPDALFFTGGYVAAPVALAGYRVPSVLYVPDIEPGQALNFLARFASRIAVSTDESMKYFPRKSDVQVTGYPVRPGLLSWERQAALQSLGLSPALPVLLVFGGSKGARSINRALLSSLPQLLAEMQVIHISGALDWPEIETLRAGLVDRLGAGLPLDQRVEIASRYHAYPYLHEEMGAALAVADLAVSRAGAATLGEFPAFGVPAILVPYPYAWHYQKVNAQYLVQRGAARMIEDQDLPDKLFPTVQALVRDRARREAMRQAMQSLAHPAAAQSIAHMIRDLAAWSQERM